MVWPTGVEQMSGSGDVGAYVVGGEATEAGSLGSLGPVFGKHLEGTNSEGWRDSPVRIVVGLGGGLTEGHSHSPCPILRLEVFVD